jgi:PAS domain S-box-containing protein
MTPPGKVVPLPRIASLSWEDCRLLVDSVVDYAIFMLDPDGRVATWNIGAQKIKGYAPDEIVGQHFSRFFLPEDVAAGKPERELSAASELGRIEDEGWRVRKDGTPLWVNVVITALRDETGRLRGFAKVTRDLTEKKRADEKLRASEERFHHLVDAVTDYAIFMLDANGFVTTWNAGAVRAKGYQTDEIIGEHFSVFYTPEDRAAGKPRRVLETVGREGRYEEEGWRVRKDGTRFWASVVITSLKDHHGRLLGFAKVTRDLTFRRQAEEQLRKSEERFRVLLESVTDYAIYMLDPEGHVATWNSGAQRMKGYTASEILGRHFSVFFVDEEVREGKPRRELEVAREQGRFEDEGCRVRKDGTRFWANVVVSAVRDGTGQLVGFAKVTRDLTAQRAAQETERKLFEEQAARIAAEAAEQRIRESEERYRALSGRLEVILEGVADGISVQDRDGKLVFANTAAARLSGLSSPNELLEASPVDLGGRFEIRHADGRPFEPAEFPGRRVLRGEEPGSALMHVRDRVSGRERWWMMRAGAVHGKNGEPELAVNIWHDVTVERRQDEHAAYLGNATVALATSLNHEVMLSTLARSLVPGLADWCSIYLREGDQLRNVALAHSDRPELVAARMYVQRFSPDSGDPRGPWNVVRSGQSELYNDVSEDLIEQVARSFEHAAVLRAVRIRSVLIVPVRVRDSVIGAIVLFASDSGRRYDPQDLSLVEEIGRRAGAAVENAQLYKAAQEAAKAAEEANRIKDEFLATVSHELRTPLNAIVGWAAILRHRQLDEDVARAIDIIDRNAHAQVKIIEDILDVSRIITGKLHLEQQRADLVSIAREAIEVVRPSAVAKQIAIELDADPASCIVVGDPERLQQVVWNLLSNAVKFTDARGSICIAIRQQASHAVLSVSDTGRGIEPEFLPFVFDRFKQADASTTRRFGGLGLGLALVRHIVELHGGLASAESAGLGKGSTFKVTLPVAALLPPTASETAASASGPVSERGLLRGIRVLVVDDEADARELLAAVLSEARAVVETAASAAEAFAALGRFQPHVVVSDIGMPEEDGYSFMRRVRALDAADGGGVPSIALSAYTRNEDRTKAAAAGFTTHIGKPVSPDGIVAAVQNLAAFARR